MAAKLPSPAVEENNRKKPVYCHPVAQYKSMSRVALFLFERASFTDTDSCAECRTKERDTRKWRDGKTDQFPRDKSSNCVLLPFLSASSVLTHWPDQRQALECIHLMRISTVGEEDTGESALCMEPLATLAASCFVGHLIFVWFLTAQSTGRRLRVVTRKLSGRLLEHRCGKTSAEIKCFGWRFLRPCLSF